MNILHFELIFDIENLNIYYIMEESYACIGQLKLNISQNYTQFYTQLSFEG